MPEVKVSVLEAQQSFWKRRTHKKFTRTEGDTHNRFKSQKTNELDF